MASRMAVAPPNIVTHSRHKGLCFTSPPQQCVMLKLRSLSIKANQAHLHPTTSWSFHINSDIHCASKAESCKFTLRAAMGLSSDAQEGKTAEQLAKPNHPKMPILQQQQQQLSLYPTMWGQLYGSMLSIVLDHHPKMSMKEKNPKRLNSSASQRIMLDYTKIFKYPLVTDLAMREMIENNTLTFIVDKQADKENIKAAAMKMFKIQTRKVNTLMMPDGNKKAYLMLKPDHNAAEIAKKLRMI